MRIVKAKGFVPGMIAGVLAYWAVQHFTGKGTSGKAKTGS